MPNSPRLEDYTLKPTEDQVHKIARVYLVLMRAKLADIAMEHWGAGSHSLGT